MLYFFSDVLWYIAIVEYSEIACILICSSKRVTNKLTSEISISIAVNMRLFEEIHKSCLAGANKYCNDIIVSIGEEIADKEAIIQKMSISHTANLFIVEKRRNHRKIEIVFKYWKGYFEYL
jgi:hypothetical protein